MPRKSPDAFLVITEHPMTPLERRTVSSLGLLYSFRMLGLFIWGTLWLNAKVLASHLGGSSSILEAPAHERSYFSHARSISVVFTIEWVLAPYRRQYKMVA